ncbi:MAG: DUF362 domain-containing protein [Actinomycetota bacterium]
MVASGDHGGIDRRTLLRGALASGVALGAAGVGLRLRRGASLWNERVFSPPGEARVAVLGASSYTPDLSRLLQDGLSAIGVDVRGASVLLKPNLVEYDPGTSINTDPRIVAAAVLAFRRLGAVAVTVGEGPGHRRDTMYVVERSGLADALRGVDAPFVDLNVDAVDAVPLSSSYTTLRELWLPRSVTRADIVVSMPKMKTHHWAGVTLSLKNCFGCVPSRIYGWPKNVLHYAGIDGSILDVAAAVRPDLAIVDGIVAMEGNGPISGTPVSLGAIVVADDPVAADVVSAGIMGMDPERIAYLAEAGRFLGQSDRDRITMRGEDPSGLTMRLAPAPGFDGLPD